MSLARRAFAGSDVLLELGARRNARWQPHAVKRSGIFCYRGLVSDLPGEEAA